MDIYEWLMFGVALASLVVSVISTVMKIVTKKNPNREKNDHRHKGGGIIE